MIDPVGIAAGADAASLIGTLALVLGAGWCAGINLYATLAVLGLLHRYADGFALPGEMAVLGSNWVIWPAVFMYLVEFFTDKVPAIDSLWDTVHTFIRIPAGAVLAGMAVGEVPLEMQLAAGILGGTLALGSHATKSTTRMAAHSTGTSPVASPSLSLAEDVLVVGTIGLIAANPMLALLVLVVMLAAAVLLMWTFWRVARRVWRTLFRRRPPAKPAPAT